LRPGGLLILETPNPENLVVGTSSFYDDPSHLRPLPPKLLAFAVEFGGFGRHSVLRLQEAPHLEGPLQLYDVLAGVSPDYAVVAQKDGPPELMSPLEAQFAMPRGVDLHTLAQRYQQQQDSMADELAQLRASEEEHALAVRHQLAEVDAQIVDVHSSETGLESQLAQLAATQAALADQVAQLEGEPAAARLRLRIAAAEQAQQASESEHARLAAHVSWLEGRLGHTEAEAADLRYQLLELQRRQGGVGARTLRVLRRLRQRLTPTEVKRYPRRLASALVRRLIQATLRRPAIKRRVRTIVMRFPGLHSRLLRMMYAQAPASDIVPVEADPLTAHMSPRSLAIYRSLSAAKKQKD
jgi:O-antigen chain-terminating methyltransferase